MLKIYFNHVKESILDVGKDVMASSTVGAH
jgi:hypothetical protein